MLPYVLLLLPPLLLYFMFTINYIKSSTVPPPPPPLYFAGDPHHHSSLHSNLHGLCGMHRREHSHTTAKLLIIINRLKLNSQYFVASSNSSLPTEQQQQCGESQLIKSYFRGHECEFVHFREDISPRELLLHLKRKRSIFRFKTLQLIYDFTRMNITDHRVLFASLATIYKKCHSCSPFIVLLSGGDDWSSTQAALTSETTDYNFSSVFILATTEQNNNNNSILYYRPILDGCHQSEGIYIPKTRYDFERLKISYKRCNLHNAILNVSVNDDLPFCQIIQQQNNKRLVPGYSVEMELLRVFEEKFYFTANLISGNKAWGVHQNGSWTGIIGQVANRTSQFGMCELTVTQRRLRSVDFTEFLFLDQTTFISQRPGIVSRGWILAGVGNYFWFFNLCSILVVLVVIKLIGLVELNGGAQTTKSLDAFSYENILLKLYGIYLRQSTNFTQNMSLSPLRIIYGVWILATLILANYFCTNFFSIITVPEYHRPLDTIEQLLQVATDDSHYLILVEQSAQLNELLNATAETNRVFHTIGQHINRTAQKMLADMSETIGAVENDSRVVALGTRINLDTRRQLFASMPLHIGTDALDQNYLALPLQKKSPLLQPFNMIIKRMREMGFIDFWLSETIRKHSKRIAISLNTDENARALTSSDLNSLYLAWSFGIGLALVNFLFEIVTFLFQINNY